MKKTSLKSIFYLLIVIIIGIGLYAWLDFEAKKGWEEEKEVVQENPIQIIKQPDGSKLVRNVKEGFEVTVPEGWEVYSKISDRLDIQNFERPKDAYSGLGGEGCVATISKEENFRYTSLDNWAYQYCSDDPDCKEYKIKDIIDGKNRKWREIRFFGTFVGTGIPLFNLIQNNVVYTVRWECSDEDMLEENQDFFRNLLTSFTFPL